MKECYLYKQLKNNKCRCNTCNHRCIILPDKTGICGVRKNIDGKLYLLVYGRACAENIDPVEKKPLYHFLPGTYTLTISTVGCNFRCQWCQNYDISQGPKDTNLGCKVGQCDFNLSPEKIIQDTIKAGCPSISYSYTEPTIYLEYALDTMKLAHKNKLMNIWVSNGYMSRETLDLIAPYLDAINVDIKSFKDKAYQKYCGARLQPILNNIIEFEKRGIHIELTTLIVTGVNDSVRELTQIAKFIKNKVGSDTPWHVSRYFPAYKLTNPPTSVEKVEEAAEIGKKVGLKYVHAGNI